MRIISKGLMTFATHTLLARSYPAVYGALALKRVCCIHFAQSVDNYFVYVISDLISTSAEYLRYDETVSVAIKTETRIHFARKLNLSA